MLWRAHTGRPNKKAVGVDNHVGGTQRRDASRHTRLKRYVCRASDIHSEGTH